MSKEKLFQIGVKSLITNSEGEILVLDSGDWHLKHQKRHWDIPGGRMQEGEDMLETLVREVAEETGIVTTHDCEILTIVQSNFKDIPVNGNMVGLMLIVYKVTISDASKLKLSKEHVGYEWVSAKEAAKRLAYKYPVDFTKLLLE